MKYILIITIFLIFTAKTYATICDFWWYEIKGNNVYWITSCDEEFSTIIPFIDKNSFVINKNDKNQASDAYYNFYQNYIVSQKDWSDFKEINEYIFTDKKNIFIKTQDVYLYISKYVPNLKIYTFYETDNSSSYLLQVKWELYSINISDWYISYNLGIYKINNIKKIKDFRQINSFIYTDEKNFYSAFLNNKESKWLHSWFILDTADLFSSNSQQLFEINNLWNKMLTLNYSYDNKEKLKSIYKKLLIIKNPYIIENDNKKYSEFFIKKELLIHYLWIIIKD